MGRLPGSSYSVTPLPVVDGHVAGTCKICGIVVGLVCSNCGFVHGELSEDGKRCTYCSERGFTPAVLKAKHVHSPGEHRKSGRKRRTIIMSEEVKPVPKPIHITKPVDPPKREEMTVGDINYNKMMDPETQMFRITYILRYPPKSLDAKSWRFVYEMQSLLNNKFTMIEPQAKWLQDIYDKTS